MVLDGKVNSEIVNLLNHRGVRAVGLSGKDAGLIEARKKLATVYDGDTAKKVDIGYVGEVANVNTDLLEDLLDQDYVPIIAPIGVGKNGESYNINADYVAAEIAGALQAEKLLLLTDIEGIYKNFNDKSTFISTLHLPEAREYIKEGIIAARIAAHAADLAKGIPGAQEWDDAMSKARVDVDFDKMISLSIDPEKARRYYESSKPECEGTCTMCGKMCPARTMKKILAGEDVSIR